MKRIRSINFNSHLLILGIAFYSSGPKQVQEICRQDIKDCATSIKTLYQMLIEAEPRDVSAIMSQTLKDI